MPQVYDPTGGSMFRSRRRRKRNAAPPKAVDAGKPESNASASQKLTSNRLSSSIKKVSVDDSLEFGSSQEIENSADSTKKRKQRGGVLSNEAKATTITPTDLRTSKRGKGDRLDKPSNAPRSLSSDLAESPLSKRDNSTTSTENCFQYAIALDTRHIDTPAGKSDQQDFLDNVQGFLRNTFHRRGFSTSSVTWTESCSSNAATNIRSEPIEKDNSDDVWHSIHGVPIPSPLNEENTKIPLATRLPKGLMPRSSWNIVGDLVETIVNRNNPLVPLKVVVFTSAASFLLDDNVPNHATSIDAFWDKTVRFFREFKIQSIEIVVVMGETIIDRTEDHPKTTPENDCLADGSESDKSDSKNMRDSDTVRDQELIIDKRADIEKALTDSMAKQVGILKSMKQHIESKVEADLINSRSRLHLDSNIDGKQLPVNISISAIDVAMDFSSFCQKWSRESLREATTSKLGQTLPVISFQLPETVDFDACDISFTAYYKNMPFRVDSAQALRLYEDLMLLSKSRLQIVQLVPVSSIDASLIYGVTIGLRCAHENDEESHHEKNYLVQSLFQRLATRDCALLLQSNNDQDMDQVSKPDGLFHSCEEQQQFLFMPEYVVSKEGPVAPKSGVLYRIASVDHILPDTFTSDLLKPVHPPHAHLGVGNSKLGVNPFSDYVEDSLDSLHCSPLNPWLQTRPSKSTSNSDIVEEQKRASSSKPKETTSSAPTLPKHIGVSTRLGANASSPAGNKKNVKKNKELLDLSSSSSSSSCSASTSSKSSFGDFYY